MKLKVLQDFANVFCQMFVGWRNAEDFPKMVQLGHGRIQIDVLAARCRLDGSAVDGWWIADEMQAWFLDRLEHNRIPLETILRAGLDVDFQIDPEPKKPRVVHVLFTCRSEIETENRTFSADLTDTQVHIWGSAGEPWPSGGETS